MILKYLDTIKVELTVRWVLDRIFMVDRPGFKFCWPERYRLRFAQDPLLRHCLPALRSINAWVPAIPSVKILYLRSLNFAACKPINLTLLDTKNTNNLNLLY